MVLLQGGPVPNTGQILISRVFPIPRYFVYVVASTVLVTLAHLAAARGIFPLCFRRQAVTVRSRVDRYRPSHRVEIAKLRVRLVVRVFLTLVYVVIRFQVILNAPPIAVLDAVVPAYGFHWQVVTLECRGIASHNVNPFLLGYVIFANIKARYSYTFSIVIGVCVLECPTFD